MAGWVAHSKRSPGPKGSEPTTAPRPFHRKLFARAALRERMKLSQLKKINRFTDSETFSGGCSPEKCVQISASAPTPSDGSREGSQ